MFSALLGHGGVGYCVVKYKHVADVFLDSPEFPRDLGNLELVSIVWTPRDPVVPSQVP